mgnify:CR=1 FL=1
MKMTQKQFWSLPCIRAAQEIQKQNPYGSEKSRKAYASMKAKCAEIMGSEFAEEYFGEY